MNFTNTAKCALKAKEIFLSDFDLVSVFSLFHIARLWRHFTAPWNSLVFGK